jgi:uncharacterized protein (TIGR00297 family)
MPTRRWVAGGVLGVAVASAAYWRRALTLDGAVAAAIIGWITFARGGPPAVGALLGFFTSSSLLSRVGERRKQHLPLAQAKGARRDAWQVLANGGVATLCLTCGQSQAFLGALAAAAADTWGTELGLLARQPPRLITTLRTVSAGTSGGITPEGLTASLAGALVVAATWTISGGRRRGLRSAAAAGLAGSLVDSLLGATVQAAYACPTCGLQTEEPVHRRCGSHTHLEHGYAWMTNDAVNALATLTGAIVGVLLSLKRQTRRDTSGEGANVRRRAGWGEFVLCPT